MRNLLLRERHLQRRRWISTCLQDWKRLDSGFLMTIILSSSLYRGHQLNSKFITLHNIFKHSLQPILLQIGAVAWGIDCGKEVKLCHFCSDKDADSLSLSFFWNRTWKPQNNTKIILNEMSVQNVILILRYLLYIPLSHMPCAGLIG